MTPVEQEPVGDHNSASQGASDALRLAVVSAGAGDPSSTRMLADRTAAAVSESARAEGTAMQTDVIELRHLAEEVMVAITSQFIGERLQRAIAILRDADGIVVSTPVYKAAPSGLFSSFFQVLDNDLLIAKPVVLAATAGTARHALVVDDQMRPFFAYLRTMTTPTSLFASTEDWNDSALSPRIERAGRELFLQMSIGFERRVRESSWDKYQHSFGSAGGTETEIRLDTDLMRLATGGAA
ncbi:CE1759 family FMN reductase [Nesterenkonia suensis]